MKKFFLILSLIALLVFSSCEFGTPEAEKSYYKGAIEIGTSSSSLTRSLENQYKKEFESGDMISVFVYQEGKTDPVADNAILKYDGTGAWTEVVYREAVDEQEQAAGYFEASEEEKKMAWTGEGGAYTFIATYPAITNDIKITDGKVSFDLYNNPTQLFAAIIKDKAAPTTAEEAKVTLTLDPLLGGVQTMSDLASGMKISAYTAFTFDVTSGGVETVGSKKSLSFSKDEDGYYCSPWLIPQEITISGNEFSNTLDIAAGKIITIKEETKVESISLNTTSLNLEFNGNSVETYDLTPKYTPTDAYTKNAVWTSSDERVATVADGVVTIVGPGSATITLSVGEASAECQVKVTGIKFGAEASYSGSGTAYKITGTTDNTTTLTEPLVTVCGDYTITLNGITVGSESSRVTQPIVRVMGGTLTIKLSGTNTVYTTGAGSDKDYFYQQSNSVINLVGKDANVVIEGSLTSDTAKTLSDERAADLVINECLYYTGSEKNYGHDALIGGSAGDIIGDITIKNAKINFVYATGYCIASAMIGSGSCLSNDSNELGSTGKLTVENSVIDVTTTSFI